MKAAKKALTILAVVVVLLLAVFLAGRYGWKLRGFQACQSAGIESVAVSESAVQITGFYPGSFPEGFCGYYAEEQDGTLYVGFRFSAVFGVLEPGSFDITIPVKGKITEVILKTGMGETSVWKAQTGSVFQSERDGVYVKLARSDACYISMSYAGFSGGVNCADHTALECGEYFFMDNDIMMVSKDAGAPVPFTITIKDASETVVASGEFSFDANIKTMYLTFTADGRIVEDARRG